jgi:hypothetical protein
MRFNSSRARSDSAASDAAPTSARSDGNGELSTSVNSVRSLDDKTDDDDDASITTTSETKKRHRRKLKKRSVRCVVSVVITHNHS